MRHPAYQPGGTGDPSIHAAAELALTLVPDGARVGLGSGRAVLVFIAKLGLRRREGLRVNAVAASEASSTQARMAGLSLVELAAAMPLDITVDGADEVAPNLDLIKGWGGALVRERIVAAASRRQVILVGQDKLVRRLGEHGRLPIEVIPFATEPVTRELEALGLTPTLRMDSTGPGPGVTENGNVTIDCDPGKALVDGAAARDLERTLLAIAGVVDTGLFLGTADRVLVGHPDGRVDTLERPDTEATRGI